MATGAMVWFAGAHITGPNKEGQNVLSIFEKHQPNSIFTTTSSGRNIRWGEVKPNSNPILAGGLSPTRQWCG